MSASAPSESMDQLYPGTLLEHHRRPRHRGRLSDPDLRGEAANPLCGDRVVVEIVLEGDDGMAQLAYHGEGCAISQASASMMMELLHQRSLSQAGAVAQLFEGMLLGADPPTNAAEMLGELQSMRSLRAFPVRLKCALLVCRALQKALEGVRRQPPPGR